MDLVTFETAKRLKDAGFPFLEIQHGVVFYNDKGSSILCAHVGDVESRCCNNKSAPSFFARNSLIRDCYFAPTATDILPFMTGISLQYVDTPFDGTYWTCFDDMGIYPGFYPVNHANPAEACALAWLALNEKK